MRNFQSVLCCLMLPILVHARSVDTDFASRIAAARTDSAKAVLYRDALTYYYGKNADSLKYYTDKGLGYFRANGYKIGEGEIIAQLALFDKREGRSNIALQRLHYALDIFRKEGYTSGVVDVMGNIGSVEAARGNFEVAAKYITESLKLGEPLGKKHAEMVAYSNLGNIYIQQNDFSTASKYFDKAYAVSRTLPLSDGMLALYNAKGALYAMQGKNDSALACFQHNLELTGNNEFVAARVECLSYLGQYYIDARQKDKAIKVLNEGMELATEHNLLEIKSNILLTLAVVYQEKDVAATIRYMDEALEIAKSMDNKAFMALVYESQASYYKDLGRYKEALFATEQKQKINDSLFNINKSIELSSIASTYELEKSNVRVQGLETLSHRNARQRNILLVVAITIFVLCVILLIYFRKTIILNRRLRKYQGELKELNLMKDKLFSIVGHDLRGPVSRIPAMLDIYEDPETAGSDKRMLLANLREHSMALLEMLDKLLLWGQSLVKGTRMQLTKVNVKEIVRQNTELKRLALDEKSLHISYNISADTAVYADRTHFDFIVRNLISNAIKYCNHGGAIVVSADTETKPGYTIISVTDNGVGIAGELLPDIFNPSFSVPGTADEKGAGIALTLCREFALLNGGDIWAESEKGKGAAFHVSLKSA